MSGAAFVVRAWSANGSGQRPAEPFRMSGNFYCVGANDVTSFLITGPEGHILIDGGYSDTAPLILASIAKLGFDVRDVRMIFNSEPHMDHAGGLSALQQASGAALWASDASAEVIDSGGHDPNIAMPWRILFWSPLFSYPAARADHRVKDGDIVRVGLIALTAHITGGHTHGCTSWSFPVRDIPCLHRHRGGGVPQRSHLLAAALLFYFSTFPLLPLLHFFHFPQLSE